MSFWPKPSHRESLDEREERWDRQRMQIRDGALDDYDEPPFWYTEGRSRLQRPVPAPGAEGEPE